MIKSVLLIIIGVSLLYGLPQTTITETGDGYTITVTTPSLEREIVAVNEMSLNGTPVAESFESITLKGYGLGTPWGTPSLPRGVLEIAYEGDVPSIRVADIQSETITLNNRILPSQPLPSYSLTSPLKFEIEEASYRSRRSDNLVAVGDTFRIRDQQGVQLIVSPVSYNAEAGTITVVTSFTIHLEMDKPSRVRSSNSAQFDKLIRASFENLQENRTIPSDLRRGKEKYLIIAADRFAESDDLARFVKFRGMTHDVELVSLSEIGGSSKSALHTKIDDANPSYLLFVGEYSDFPSYDGANMSQMTQGQMQGVVKTYLNYIDGGDKRPDISLGLFFVRDVQSLKNIVDKTINNQNNLDQMGMGYLCFAGHNRYGQAPMTATHIDEIFTDFERQYWNPLGFDLTKVYAAGSPNQSDCRKVVSTLNEGLRFLNYNGHGLEMGWNFTQSPQNDIWGEGYFAQGGSSYNLEAFGAISNTVNPFVISCACLTGQFKNSGPSWAETWIGHENLATAFIGSSEISFGNQHAMNAYLMEAIKDHDITTFGDMFVFAINQSFGTNKFSNFWASEYAEIGAQEYHFFGDPAVETMELIPIDTFITLTAPSGGDTLAVGEKTVITWSSNSEESVSITLIGAGSEVIVDQTENDGEYEWDIPGTIADGDYFIAVHSGDVADTSDMKITLKTIPMSQNLVAFGDWFVVSDEYEGEHKSEATLDTSDAEAICGRLKLGLNDDANMIWPWASLTCEPANLFTGATSIKVIYKSSVPVTLTLNDTTLNESGAQYGYPLPATTGYSEVIISVSNFKQPEWTPAADSVTLDLSQVNSLSFNPEGSYGKESEIMVKELVIFNVDWVPVGVVLTEKGSLNKRYSIGMTSRNLTLSVPKAGHYDVALYSLKGQILFKHSATLNEGTHSLQLGSALFGSQVAIITVKGVAGTIHTKHFIK